MAQLGLRQALGDAAHGQRGQALAQRLVHQRDLALGPALVLAEVDEAVAELGAQLAELLHHVAAVVEQAAHRLAEALQGLGGGGLQRGVDALQQLRTHFPFHEQIKLVQQILFVLEINVDRRRRDACRPGNFRHRSVGEPVCCNKLDRRVTNRLMLVVVFVSHNF